MLVNLRTRRIGHLNQHDQLINHECLMNQASKEHVILHDTPQRHALKITNKIGQFAQK